MVVGLLNCTRNSDTHKRPFFTTKGLSKLKMKQPDKTAKAHFPRAFDEQAEREMTGQYDQGNRNAVP
jgi:hypothetical protein